MKKLKLAYVSVHPAPYRDAFLARLVESRNLDVRVYSILPYDAGHRFWNLKTPAYSSTELCDYSMTRRRICWILLKTFLFSGYDHICWPGFLDWYQKVPLVLFALFGKSYSLCVDTVEQRKISPMAYAVKRWLVRKASFVFVPGEASVRFFVREFGIPRARLVKGAYSLDGEEIEKRILAMRESPGDGKSVRQMVRERLNITETDRVYLMVANMLPTRHYPITSAAFVKFAEKHSGARFIMVGKGQDTESMQRLAERNDCLRVVPGCSFEEMLELYAAADVYVHGGTEPASTALVIGAIAHLPLISSPAVGCYFDVVKDGETGVSVGNYLDEGEWIRAFERMEACAGHWCQMGECGRGFSMAIDVQNVVAEFEKMVQ